MVAITRIARCSCGQLQVDCEGEPTKVSVCHCLDCQRRTGSAFGVAVFYPGGAARVSGKSAIYTRGSDSGFPVTHHFCPHCGTTVFWYPARKAGMVAVGLGCFADSTFPAPHQQVFEHHRHGWVDLNL